MTRLIPFIPRVADDSEFVILFPTLGVKDCSTYPLSDELENGCLKISVKTTGSGHTLTYSIKRVQETQKVTSPLPATCYLDPRTSYAATLARIPALLLILSTKGPKEIRNAIKPIAQGAYLITNSLQFQLVTRHRSLFADLIASAPLQLDHLQHNPFSINLPPDALTSLSTKEYCTSSYLDSTLYTKISPPKKSKPLRPLNSDDFI